MSVGPSDLRIAAFIAGGGQGGIGQVSRVYGFAATHIDQQPIALDTKFFAALFRVTCQTDRLGRLHQAIAEVDSMAEHRFIEPTLHAGYRIHRNLRLADLFDRVRCNTCIGTQSAQLLIESNNFRRGTLRH